MRITVAILLFIPAVIQASPAGALAGTARIPAPLEGWSRPDSFPLEDSLRSFKSGMEQRSGKQYLKALESFGDGQVTGSTPLGDYFLRYRADSKLNLKQNAAALSDFQRLDALFPNSPLALEGLLAQCQILLSMKEFRAVLAILDRPGIGTSAEILYYRAKALEMAGEKSRASDLYLQIYSRYPASKYSPLAERYFTSSSPGAFKGKRNFEPRLERAGSLIEAGSFRAARTILLALGKASAPSSALSAKRNLLFGEVEYRLGKSSAAIPYLRRVPDSIPSLHVQALYLEGLCSRRLDKKQAFLDLRDRLLKLYPKSPEAEELCYSVATYFDVNYEAMESRKAYAVLYEAFPGGKYAERSRWKLALSSYSDRKYDEALLGFWKSLLAYPNPSSADAAMYWMGRCYEKLNDAASAQYLYRQVRALANESYYGLLAKEREASLEKVADPSRARVAGIDFSQVVAKCDGIRFSSAEFKEPGPSSMNAIRRARLLVGAGLPELALTELRWAQDQNSENNHALGYVMACIYASRKEYDSAIRSLRRAFPNYLQYPAESLPEEIWEIFFPVRYWKPISEHAGKQGIDPNLVLGLIRQESAFNESARSRANARGLMQILPSTGRRLARQARIPRYSLSKLYQADTNIALGILYFASVLRQFGKPELALAAYNAGNSRVDRWLKEWGDADMAEFVEQIPFSETRGYVKQVLSNQARYQLRTASDRQEKR